MYVVNDTYKLYLVFNNHISTDIWKLNITGKMQYTAITETKFKSAIVEESTWCD